jgi:Histidine kinase-, DNA gyrase B-, and HSP90-like ATPase
LREQASGAVELIPAASRLIGSLRDMGYEFTTAVADLVDNSIEAGATLVSIDVEFEGEDSWVRIADNGVGMTSSALREALRYGSSRVYSANDLGKFGLGLKVASLSQCKRLVVASRHRDRSEPTAYCWDLGHIEKTNRWELVPIKRDAGGPALFTLLREAAGTVVLWQRLDRILGYESPEGDSARRRLATMCRDVEGHLAVVFHRFLSGEVRGRPKLTILLNGSRVVPWDPYARSEPATKLLEPVTIQVCHGGHKGQLTLEPFVLPHQLDFSSPESFRRASGPASWNQQQGFYVYRADRLIQSGGWCRLRTFDEHTKLARVALRFSPQLDDAFRVNVAKMRVQLPASMREQITTAISPVTKLANDVYRRASGPTARSVLVAGRGSAKEAGPLFAGSGGRSVRTGSFNAAVNTLLDAADPAEQKVIRRVAARVANGLQ